MWSIWILSILSLLCATVYSFTDHFPTEIFYTDYFTYFPIKCTNTIYVHLKTKGYAEIRLRTEPMAASTKVSPGYELCIGCPDRGNKFKTELRRNGVTVAIATTPSLNSTEWNSFTIAWSYSDKRLMVGEKGSAGPILHWLEMPVNDLIPIEYVGIRTQSPLIEKASHWIISLGGRARKDFRTLIHSGFEMPFQPDDTEGCPDFAGTVHESEEKARMMAHEKAKLNEAHIRVKRVGFDGAQAIRAAKQEAYEAEQEYELQKEARDLVRQDLRDIEYSVDTVLTENELQSERKYHDEMAKARKHAQDAIARQESPPMPEGVIDHSPRIVSSTVKTPTGGTPTGGTPTAAGTTDTTSTATNPTTEEPTTEKPSSMFGG